MHSIMQTTLTICDPPQTRLIKHGNLGETGFVKSFQSVCKEFQRVSKGFQIPETGVFKGLSKGLQSVSKAFLKSFKPLETT